MDKPMIHHLDPDMNRPLSFVALGCALATIAFACVPEFKRASSTYDVEVVDGDTLDIEGVRYRLDGVDAPEMHDVGGVASKNALQRMIAQTGEVTCRATGGTTHGRTVAICGTGHIPDLGRALVVQGYALDCPKFSGGRYARLEHRNAVATQRRASYCGRPGE